MFSVRLVAAGCAVVCLALPAAAAAGKAPKAAAGYDISYPQCGGPFPTKVLFGIVGVELHGRLAHVQPVRRERLRRGRPLLISQG
jgi:hypothetical protein